LQILINAHKHNIFIKLSKGNPYPSYFGTQYCLLIVRRLTPAIVNQFEAAASSTH